MREEECEVKNKRGGGGGAGGGAGWVINGERGNREGGEERRGAHFYQSEIFDSAERVTLRRKTKAASLSLFLLLSLCNKRRCFHLYTKRSLTHLLVNSSYSGVFIL